MAGLLNLAIQFFLSPRFKKVLILINKGNIMETPYEKGFFAALIAHQENNYTDKEKNNKCPYPCADAWGDKSYFATAREEFFRGWNSCKSI